MSLEKIILSNLIYNEAYTRKVLPFLLPEFFNNAAERTVFVYIKEFIGKYNVNPTKEALAINITNSPLSEGMYEEVFDVIKTIESDNNDIGWLSCETEKWAQNSAIYSALNKAIEIAEGNDKDLDKNAIPSILMDALGVSFDSHVGHDYFESAEAQWEYKHSSTSKFPFTLDILNKVTKNGVPNKTLNIVAAPINGGKSVHLIQQCADWLAGGKDVLYISMEMAEEEVRERIDVV